LQSNAPLGVIAARCGFGDEQKGCGEPFCGSLTSPGGYAVLSLKLIMAPRNGAANYKVEETVIRNTSRSRHSARFLRGRRNEWPFFAGTRQSN
jgi:hypothetical protein